MRRLKRLHLLAIPAAAALAAVALALFAGQRALTRSASNVRDRHQLVYTLSAIDLTSRSPGPAFEPVATPSAYTSGVFLERNLYLAGPAGLSIYGADGELLHTLRSGSELPIEPIVAIATGRLRGATDPQILLATAGAGLMVVTPNSTGLPTISQLLPATANARDLTALLPLASGDLLLGTRHGGVLVWNGSVLRAFRVPSIASDGKNPDTLEVTSLASSDSASVLIGTRSSGLLYARGGTVERVDTSTGMPDRQIESLLVVGQHAYAGTPRGIAEFDLSAQPLRATRTLAPSLFAHTLAYDAATNQLLVGTLDQGIQQVSLTATPHLHNASISAPRDAAASASTQRIDAFLSAQFALADGILVHRTSSTWTPTLPATSNTLTDRNVSALAFAADGSLYVGFFDHGLDILAPDILTPDDKIRHLEDDHLFCINRLALDPVRQTIAAATANGLVLFDRDGTPRQTLTRRDGLISDHITEVAFTRSGLTLATPAGLTFMTATGAESLYAFEGLVNNHVYALAAQSGTDHLLAGTLGGISILEAETVRRNLTATNSGLKHNWITALLPLPNGGTLIGTYGAGLQQLAADGTFTTLDLPAGAPRDLIINPNAIFATQDHLYAGTLDHGLLAFSEATGRWSVITRGLPSLNVTAFAARNGELYIGTENGLVRIAETVLEAQLQ